MELFQAQGVTGVAWWNYQRLVDLKQPGVLQPDWIARFNAVSMKSSSGEKFSLAYVTSGCLVPGPLNWDKHRTNKGSMHAPSTPFPLCSSTHGPVWGFTMTPTKVFPGCLALLLNRTHQYLSSSLTQGNI